MFIPGMVQDLFQKIGLNKGSKGDCCKFPEISHFYSSASETAAKYDIKDLPVNTETR